MDAAPIAVLISVGQSEQSITTMAETTKLFGNVGSGPVIVAEITIVTMGSHASGLTGFMICTIGLIAALNVFERPQIRPMGTAKIVARKNPRATVAKEVHIWSRKVGEPLYSKFRTTPPSADAAEFLAS